MASPQTENGFTRIANELLEALMRYRCSGGQKDLILAVIRTTYGFHRKSWGIGTAHLARVTGRHKRKVAFDIQHLITNRVLMEVEPPSKRTSRVIALNKNYEQWLSPKSVSVNEHNHRSLSEITPLSVSESAHPIKKDLKKRLKKRDGVSREIYEIYHRLVRPGARSNAVRNIQKLLNQHSPEVLVACILAYVQDGMPEDLQYRIQANNFFGLAARYEEYLVKADQFTNQGLKLLTGENGGTVDSEVQTRADNPEAASLTFAQAFYLEKMS